VVGNTKDMLYAVAVALQRLLLLCRVVFKELSGCSDHSVRDISRQTLAFGEKAGFVVIITLRMWNLNGRERISSYTPLPLVSGIGVYTHIILITLSITRQTKL